MARIIWREPKPESRSEGNVGERREVKPSAVRPLQKASKEDKLEARSQKDGAWYEAQVHLRAGGVEIAYRDFPNDNELWKLDIVKSLDPLCRYIRVLSGQLQDAECSQVSVNNRVCALNEKGSLRRYYDAIITEVERRPHDFNGTEENCTCVFVAKWQHGPRKGETGTLQCDKICVLSTKDVKTHPDIVGILDKPNAGTKQKQEHQDPPTGEIKCQTSVTEGYQGPPAGEHKCKSSIPEHQGPPAGEVKCNFSSRPEVPPASELKRKRISTNTPDDPPCQENGVRKFKRLKSKSPLEEENLGFDTLSDAPAESEVQYVTDSFKADCGNQSCSSNLALPGGDSHERPEKETKPINLVCNAGSRESADQLQGNSSQSKSVSTCSSPDLVCQPCGSDPRSQIPEQAPELKVKKEDILLSVQTTLGDADCSRNFGGHSETDTVAKVTRECFADVKKQHLTGNVATAAEVHTSVFVSEERSDSVDETTGGSMENASAGQSVNDGKGSNIAHTGKDKPMSSRPCTGPTRSEQDVICLSDEEDAAAPQSSWSVISSPKAPSERTREKPQFNPREFLTPSTGVHPRRDEKQGWNVRFEDHARNRNALVLKLRNSESVLMVDNLDLDLQPGELLEYLLKFFPEGKVHSVHIPPPYPDVNRAVGYVVFFDKDAADSAATFFASSFVVSANGRPWVVTRQGQQLNENLVGFPTVSAFMGEVQEDDDHGSRGSVGRLRVITHNQHREYNAAKQRMKLFVEHRRQIRILFQRLAQEEKKLAADPECSLYH